MRVAVWDHLPSTLFEGPRGAEGPVEFVRIAAQDTANALAREEVDVALLDTLSVLQNTDAYDVFPAVALSSWEYPFARLLLRGGIGAKAGTLVTPDHVGLESLVARVVLREQYGSDVEVHTSTGFGIADVPDAEEDACLIMNPDGRRTETDWFDMDLGREWFELVNYPMVWGLFVAPKGHGDNQAITTLRDAVARQDALRVSRAQKIEDATVRDFVENQVRLRLDDLVVASLTELCNYVYYYGAVADYCTVPFVSLDEPNDDDGDDADPLSYDAF